MAQPTVTLSRLDFDQIRSTIQTFLQSQTQFQDYNFEGAGLVVLLNTLAYNTFWNSYYLNSLASEMFLDSAELRSSIVSLAQQLGYQVRSARGAIAPVHLVLTLNPQPSNPSTVAPVVIPAGTRFTSVVDSTTYSFTLANAASASIRLNTSNNVYELVANTNLTQGRQVSQQFTVSTAAPVRYILPNQNIDTTTIRVLVQTSANVAVQTVFQPATDARLAGPTDPVYWTRETFDGGIEIIFGNGSIGQAPVDQNLVIVTYLVCDADAPNGANSFSLVGTLANGVFNRVDVLAPASGGAPVQNSADIQFLAPRSFASQGRCITALDYETTILTLVSGLRSVAVWGGENGDPTDPNTSPAYGKVFIAIKPSVGQNISEDFKEQILDTVIRPRAVVTIQPVMVDPDYLYLKPISLVVYDSTLAVTSDAQVAANTFTAMTTFANNTLGHFGGAFRYSKFVRAIDDASPAILNNVTTIALKKLIVTTTGASLTYTIPFRTPLYQIPSTVSIWSSKHVTFSHADTTGAIQTGCFLENTTDDAGRPIMAMYRFDTATNTKSVVQPSIGTVDFGVGTVTLSNFAPTAFSNGGTTLTLYALPGTADIIPSFNQILVIDPADIVVQVRDEATSPATTPAASATPASSLLRLPGTL